MSVPAARMVGVGGLRAIGDVLGSVYRGELVRRVRLGRLDRRAHAVWGRSVSRP